MHRTLELTYKEAGTLYYAMECLCVDCGGDFGTPKGECNNCTVDILSDKLDSMIVEMIKELDPEEIELIRREEHFMDYALARTEENR